MTARISLNIDASSPISWAVVEDDQGREQLLVSLSRPGPVSDPRFDDFLETVSSRPSLQVLGAAIGSIEINSLQRSKASKVFSNRNISVVVDSPIARGIATALGWLGLNIKAYRWSQLETAFGNLKLSYVALKDVHDALERLLSKTGPENLAGMISK